MVWSLEGCIAVRRVSHAIKCASQLEHRGTAIKGNLLHGVASGLLPQQTIERHLCMRAVV